MKRAVILADHRSLRLPTEGPGCLVQVGKRALLERHLWALQSLGFERVDLVVGFRAEAVENFVADAGYSQFVRFLFNDRFEEGTILSLARALLDPAPGPVALLEAQVFAHFDVYRSLTSAAPGVCYLIDHTFPEVRRVGWYAVSAPSWEQLKVEASIVRKDSRDEGDFWQAIDNAHRGAMTGEVRDVAGLPWTCVDSPLEAIAASRMIDAVESGDPR